MTAATSNLAQLRDPAGQPWLSGQRSSQQGFENMEEELWILLGPSCLGAEKSSDDKGWLSLRVSFLSLEAWKALGALSQHRARGPEGFVLMGRWDLISK